jgi:hypothetical protein
MTDTVAATGLTVQQWDDQYNREYFQDRFKELKGEGENAIIQVREDLTKKAGDSLTVALVNRLTNSGVTGVSTLEGNEEDLMSRSMRVYVDKIRNAVRVPEMAEQRSAISLRNAARPTLLDWSKENTRDQFIAALESINGVAFQGVSTAAQRDAWLVDNLDRVVFGAGVGSGTDHSADLSAARHDQRPVHEHQPRPHDYEGEDLQSQDSPDDAIRAMAGAITSRWRTRMRLQEPPGIDRYRSSGDHQRPERRRRSCSRAATSIGTA